VLVAKPSEQLPWRMRVFQYQRPRPYHPPPPSSRIRRIIMRSVVSYPCAAPVAMRAYSPRPRDARHGTNAP